MLRFGIIIDRDRIEKARAGLVFRTDLPFHTASGALRFRSGWVLPEISKQIERAKKKGDAPAAVGKYNYQPDLFSTEGEEWAKPEKKVVAKEAKPAKVKPNEREPKLRISYGSIPISDGAAEKEAPKAKAGRKEREEKQEKSEKPSITISGGGPAEPSVVMSDGQKVGYISEVRTVGSDQAISYVARDLKYAEVGRGRTREAAATAFGYEPPAARTQGENIPPAVSKVADRIPKPEPLTKTREMVVPGRGIEQPIARTKFRDYGSWSASGKHLSADKRAKLNQNIAELLLKPSDELDKKDLDMIRQYSGFGGTKVENERGVLYDYFTSPPVARMVWKLANKIMPLKDGAKCLEPSCGTGVFFDVAPDGVDLTGVEYDARTAAVAGLLQSKARIYQSSFEQFNLHEHEKYDAVIGNAPFGERSVATSFLDEPGEKSLDKYFISRSLDDLKGGGTLAMIVAPGVMDNASNKEWRQEMLRKGQFLGALRLPNQSFKHTHTGVSPDIVMFRAYPEDIRERVKTMSFDEMRDAGLVDDDWVNASYYDANPGHRLGAVGRGQFGAEITMGALEPDDMDKAVKTFESRTPHTKDTFDRIRTLTEGRESPAAKETESLSESEAAAVAAKTLRVGMTKTIDGKVYRLNENHRWELVKSTIEGIAKKVERVKEISETVRAIREAMRADEPVDDLQRQGRALIEAYERDFGITHAEDKDVLRFIKANPAMAGVYEAITTRIGSDLLTKQNVYDKEIEIVDGHRPAIKALIEMQRNMTDATTEAVYKQFPNEAEGLLEAMWSDQDVFVDENGVFWLREDFISGNAWDRIDAIEKAIKEHPGEAWERNREKWQAGADALRDAVGWVTIEDADVFPQASWLPSDVVNRWAEEAMNRPAPDGFKYGRNEEGKWGLIATREVSKFDYKKRTFNRSDEGEWSEYNDELIYFLNNQKQRSKYTDTETYNKNALENFKAWLANDEKERTRVEELYNRAFNTELGVPTKTYAVNLDGWNDNIQIKPWQWQSIHHLYRQGKGISALGTGFGKTYAAIALLALLRQEGKVKRPMFQVPNNKVKDWVRYFGIALPGLKVGSVSPEKEGYGSRDKRYQWYQELASGDYDVIILPETSASEIQLNAENDKTIVNDIASQFTENKGKTARQKEEAKASAEGKLTGGKANKTITFEDLGCDAIFCDEAHNFKNLFTSSLSRETGMNDGRRSDRAMAFFKKCEYIRRHHDGKNAFLLTATPLTNSPLEYYNMMQHVAPEELKRLQVANIDDFIKNFADIEEGQKYDWASDQVTTGKILKGFKNLSALQDMFFKYTDFQNDPTKIGLKKPTPTNKPNILPAHEDQVEAVKRIAAEIEIYKKMTKEERAGTGDNFLTYYSRMRTASLDLELYDPANYKGWKNPKIEKMAENAMEMFKARGGGQVVFCDRVLSGDGTLNMHEKIKKALVAKGFNDSDIVIVNGITKAGGMASDQAVEKLVSSAIDGFNSGKYKIIIGTTQTIGEGVNLQKNSSALHHLDIPYRPADFIQRNGRVDRQGNKQSNVELFTYAAAGTIDNYSMNLVAGKENWINQLLRTKSNVFTNPNGDGMDMDEIMLSLSEEWGNEGDAEARRMALAEKKATAIKAENGKKAHDFLKQLALMRGALSTFKGEKGSREYQNRLRKINNIEAALRTNPEFKHPELLDEGAKPFMYDEGARRVVRIGDLIAEDGTVKKVAGFNHKDRSYSLSRLDDGTDAGIKNTYTSSKQYRHYNRDSGPIYIANPTQADLEKYKILSNSASFYQQPLEYKRDHYDEFLKMRDGVYGLNAANVLIKRDGGAIDRATWYSSDYGQTVINPFSEAGREAIRESVKSGQFSPIIYENWVKEYGPLGAEKEIRDARIKEFRENVKDADALLSAFESAKKDSEGWVNISRIPQQDNKADWETKNAFSQHPDMEWKSGYGLGEDSNEFGYYVRRKPGLEKSAPHGKVVAANGRVYVLLSR